MGRCCSEHQGERRFRGSSWEVQQDGMASFVSKVSQDVRTGERTSGRESAISLRGDLLWLSTSSTVTVSGLSLAVQS